MITEPNEDWRKLRHAANETLHNVAASGSYQAVFSFWCMPAFEDHRRATLYTPQAFCRDKQSPFLDTLVWRRTKDSEKIRLPMERLKHLDNLLEPTIEYESQEIESVVVDTVIQELASIQLPSLRPDQEVLGLDGVHYRFSFSQGYHSLDMAWWSDYPSKWREAAMKIESIVTRLKQS